MHTGVTGRDLARGALARGNEGSKTMFGSTTPVAVHPVHRANAVMRAALLSSTSAFDPGEDPRDVESLSRAIQTVMQGPVSITFPKSLGERLDALEIDDAFPSFALPTQGAAFGRPDPNGGLGMRGGLSAGDALSPEAHGLLSLQSGWDEGSAVDPDEAEAREAAALARVPQVIPQIHVQALLTEFRRRQRHANLLVAGSIATAILLTVGGLLIIAQMAVPRAIDGDNRPALRSTSVAWQRPVQAEAASGLEFAVVSANRAAKGEPLLVPNLAEPASPATGAQVILAASGRQIAFASLLPSSPAGYLLIRGLPATATLSAGRQSESGTWLVKGDYVSDLTLTMGDAAPGDYPIEVYVLQSGDAPQARRSLVLRVDAPAQPYNTYATYAPDMGWVSALLDVVPAAQAAEAPAVAPYEAKLLHDRAQRLLQEGDIAAARLLLLHLAERDEGDAAYDLARTFDRDALTELGAKGMDGDPASAHRWYERASQNGNAKATERLKILASLSGTDPSD
jgi:hypothetical protein